MGEVVLADHDIEIAIAVEVGDFQAHRPDHGRDHVLDPGAVVGGRLLVLDQVVAPRDRLEADHGVEPPVAVDVGEPVAIGRLFRPDLPQLPAAAEVGTVSI